MHKICLNKSESKSPAVAIGVFDGIHLGHQNIIKELVKHNNSCVFTFNPHPRPGTKLILPFSERLRILRELRVNTALVTTNKDRIFKQSAKEFIEAVLIKRLNTKLVIVGEDFRLGRNRETNAEEFKILCKEHDVEVKITEDLKYEGQKLSSTFIREQIANANFVRVEELLGRRYSIKGIVCKGKGLGQKIGFRTANIIPHKDIALPAGGVYSTIVRIDNSEYKSVCFVGDKTKLIIETHIPGIDINLYGKKITVSFIKKIRETKRFNSIEDLAKAIREDVKNSV